MRVGIPLTLSVLALLSLTLVSARIIRFEPRPVGLLAKNSMIGKEEKGPATPYEPVHDEIIIACFNTATRTYFNPANGLTLNSDYSQSSPLSGEVIIPCPPSGLEPTIVLPNPRALVVTIDPNSGNLVSPSRHFVDVSSRNEVTKFGETVSTITEDTIISIVTNNGTLVDVMNRHAQLNPETLEIVTNSTDAIEPIFTPDVNQPIQLPYDQQRDRDTVAGIIIVFYNSSLDLYLDIATNDVVNSDGSETDVTSGKETRKANIYTVIIPCHPSAILCTEDDAGNLVASNGDYILLKNDTILSRDGTTTPLSRKQRVMIATDQGTVVDVRSRHPQQLDPESLIAVSSNMTGVTFVTTPRIWNSAREWKQANEDLTPYEQLMSTHGVNLRFDPEVFQRKQMLRQQIKDKNKVQQDAQIQAQRAQADLTLAKEGVYSSAQAPADAKETLVHAEERAEQQTTDSKSGVSSSSPSSLTSPEPAASAEQLVARPVNSQSSWMTMLLLLGGVAVAAIIAASYCKREDEPQQSEAERRKGEYQAI